MAAATPRPSHGQNGSTTCGIPTSAPVLDYICLFTHDLKRKQKRWQDGRLKFHTFNKRVMVYDDRGNFIGDMHWSEDFEFGEGEEFQLERGCVIVQVSELVGSKEQDLTELIEKRYKDKEQRQVRAVAAASPGTLAVPSPRHRPLSDLTTTPRGNQLGRAVIPTESPFEQRTRALQGQETESPRPAKRRKPGMTATSKSGYAQSLFGAALTLSSWSSSAPSSRPTNRPRSPSQEPEVCEVVQRPLLPPSRRAPSALLQKSRAPSLLSRIPPRTRSERSNSPQPVRGNVVATSSPEPSAMGPPDSTASNLMSPRPPRSKRPLPKAHTTFDNHAKSVTQKGTRKGDTESASLGRPVNRITQATRPSSVVGIDDDSDDDGTIGMKRTEAQGIQKGLLNARLSQKRIQSRTTELPKKRPKRAVQPQESSEPTEEHQSSPIRPEEEDGLEERSMLISRKKTSRKRGLLMVADKKVTNKKPGRITSTILCEEPIVIPSSIDDTRPDHSESVIEFQDDSDVVTSRRPRRAKPVGSLKSNADSETAVKERKNPNRQPPPASPETDVDGYHAPASEDEHEDVSGHVSAATANHTPRELNFSPKRGNKERPTQSPPRPLRNSTRPKTRCGPEMEKQSSTATRTKSTTETASFTTATSFSARVPQTSHGLHYMPPGARLASLGRRGVKSKEILGFFDQSKALPAVTESSPKVEDEVSSPEPSDSEPASGQVERDGAVEPERDVDDSSSFSEVPVERQEVHMDHNIQPQPVPSLDDPQPSNCVAKGIATSQNEGTDEKIGQGKETVPLLTTTEHVASESTLGPQASLEVTRSHLTKSATPPVQVAAVLTGKATPRHQEDMQPGNVVKAPGVCIFPSIPKAVDGHVEMGQPPRANSTEFIRAQSTEQTRPSARIVNPATRGRKAAQKSDAAGVVPRSVVPPAQPTEVEASRNPRRNPVSAAAPPSVPRTTLTTTPGGAGTGEAGGAGTSAGLPGFSRAGGGPWSKCAHDLLGIQRPLP